MAEKVAVRKTFGSRIKRGPLALAGFWHVLRQNPIIVRELRHRMRSRQGLTSLIICTGLLAIFGLIAYSSISNSSSFRAYSYGYSYSNNAVRSQELGSSYFSVIIVGQLFLAFFLAPSFTAGAIAGEKERQTYDILLITLLRPRDIILGKLFSSLAYLFLVIMAGLPIASVAFIMGGVGLDQLLCGLAIMILSGLMLGSIGLYWSSVSRTSQGANRSAFINVFALLFILPGAVIFGLSNITRSFYGYNFSNYGGDPVRELMTWVFSINPIFTVLATSDILRTQPNSNLIFYFSGQGDFVITPFVRFVMLALLVTYIYLRQASRQIKPINKVIGDRPAYAQKGRKKGSADQTRR